MRRGERVGLGAWFGGGWVSILALGALSCAFGTSPPARCQDALVTEDFEGYEVGSFPSGWNDLADVVAPQEEELAVVKEAVGPDGAPSRCLELRSKYGVSQGIVRRVVSDRATYTLRADVYLIQDMPRSVENIPISLGFGSSSAGDPYSWTSSGTDGSPNLWTIFSVPSPLEQKAVGGGFFEAGRWYRVTVELNVLTGLNSTYVEDLATGTFTSGSALFSGLLDKEFDSVLFASFHKGTAGGESVVLVDNIAYGDPSQGDFPRAEFAVTGTSEGCVPSGVEIQVDASASTTPPGTTITGYRWDFGDGTRAEGVTASHVYDGCGNFTIALDVTNDQRRLSVDEEAICVFSALPGNPESPCGGEEVTVDFEADEEGQFPRGWTEYKDTTGTQTPVLVAVREAVGPTGEASRVVELRSLYGKLQGMSRRVLPQTLYRVSFDVNVEQDMPRAVDNIAIDVGFSVAAQGNPYTWTGSSINLGGTSNLRWVDYSGFTPLQQFVIGGGVQTYTWYRVTFEVDTLVGRCTTRVIDPVSGEELSFACRSHSGVVGVQYDTVYVATDQLGLAGTQAVVLVDNLSYSDPSGGLFPDAAFTVVDPPAGCFLAGEPVRLDASASTTPEGSEIVSYEWDFGDGTTGEGVSATHAFDRCGRFEIELEVTNDRTGFSTAKSTVCVVSPRPDPSTLEPWNATDVGTPVVQGSAWPTSEGQQGCAAFCVGGIGLSGRSDECHLLWQEVEGDGIVTLRLEDMTGGGSAAAVGVIFRASLDPAAAFAALCMETIPRMETIPPVRNQCRFSYRLGLGESRKGGTTTPAAAPSGWLRLRREGAAFTGEMSPDGVEWTQVGTTIEIPALGPTVLAGAVAYGRDNAASTSFQGLQATICGLEWIPSAPEGTAFRRGDANCDGTEDLSDAVRTFGFLFLGEATPCCLRAADTNRDGEVNISDGIYLLGFLFTGGAAPPAPFGACGHDPDSTLPCAEYPICP